MIPLARRSVAAVALAASLLLVGCGDASGSGPFENHDSANGYCGPLSPPDVVTQGGEWTFRNTGPEGVINSVSLSHSHGLQILSAWAVIGPDLYGNYLGYPSPKQLWAPQVRAEWSGRQRVDGARIPHTRTGDRVDLVVVIKLLASTGYTRGFDVYYHDSGGSYHLHMIDDLLMWQKGVTPPKCS